MDLFTYLNNLVAHTPVIGGALSVSLGGGLVALCWRGPRVVSELFKRWFMVTFTVNNSGYGSNTNHYHAFMRWFSESTDRKVSRALSFDASHQDGGCGPGPGTHFIFYKRRPFIVRIIPLPSSGSHLEKREIRISTFGGSLAPIRDIFEAFKDKTLLDGRLKLRRFTEFNWQDVGNVPERSLDSIALNKDKKEELIKGIDEFLSNKAWYVANGIPYKLVIMLHGAPGSGKTSLTKALANHYNRSINIVNLHALSDITLPRAFEMTTEGTILLVEEIDTSGGVSRRITESDKKEPDNSLMLDMAMGGLNLATVLNTLDGIVELNGHIVIMTTNHLDKIDPAVIRPGRVDFCVEIPWLETEEIVAFATRAFPDDDVGFPCTLIPMSGAKLQEILLANKRNWVGFRDTVLRLNNVTFTSHLKLTTAVI